MEDLFYLIRLLLTISIFSIIVTLMDVYYYKNTISYKYTSDKRIKKLYYKYIKSNKYNFKYEKSWGTIFIVNSSLKLKIRVEKKLSFIAIKIFENNINTHLFLIRRFSKFYNLVNSILKDINNNNREKEYNKLKREMSNKR